MTARMRTFLGLLLAIGVAFLFRIGTPAFMWHFVGGVPGVIVITCVMSLLSLLRQKSAPETTFSDSRASMEHIEEETFRQLRLLNEQSKQRICELLQSQGVCDEPASEN
jgi:hypothetical protein